MSMLKSMPFKILQNVHVRLWMLVYYGIHSDKRRPAVVLHSKSMATSDIDNY